jgi:hypothetical protein
MEFITLEFTTLLDMVPKPAIVIFGVIGLLVVSTKVLRFIQLLLSLFVLPGKNVCLPCHPKLATS